MKEGRRDNLAFGVGMLLGLAICITGIVVGYKELELSQRNRLIRQCDELDDALAIYASYHREADKKVYPKELYDLGAVYDEEAGLLWDKNVDFSQFEYEVVLDETSGNYIYRLGAHLPGGYYYKSKKSHE
ncbi:hypothetical protein [Selenomonas ruminis]|uniref:Uncharacterized protein n=1 Tax=Selenomonas ruminis TaxID=2593411 RepID=A0A5D6VX13_9FIRM|nr:hypothetical protein [Selenomonas sp. mPRGC5]TYZ20196.1 hypothetical protein FZ040_12165 [Selenomonas sp. mPRGC5]